MNKQRKFMTQHHSRENINACLRQQTTHNSQLTSKAKLTTIDFKNRAVRQGCCIFSLTMKTLISWQRL